MHKNIDNADDIQKAPSPKLLTSREISRSMKCVRT